MKNKIFVTLVLLCALAFLIVEGHSHSRHRSCEKKICKKPFYFDKYDCQCRCEKRSRDCYYPQVLDRKTCQCALHATTITTTQAPVTTPPPICSYGTKVYNNEDSIDGIEVGFALDATTAYVGITEVDGVTVPGTLLLNNSILPGLSYVYNNSVQVLQTSNVFYLTQTPGCNCQFFDKNATLPANSYIVTLNNGINSFGIGSTDDAGINFKSKMTVVGSVINETLHYFDGYHKIDSITANYRILVCGSESVMPTTTSTTTSSDSSTTSTETYEKRLDDIVNEFTNAAQAAVQTLANLNNLKDELIFEIKSIIANDNTTTQTEAVVYQQILDIFNSTIIGRRRKRQTQTIDSCQNATQQVESATKTVNNLKNNYSRLRVTMIRSYKIAMNNATLKPQAQDILNNYYAQVRDLSNLVNECKKVLALLIALRDEICSKTTTTISTTTTKTAAPVACVYSWKPYAGNNLPPPDGFYVGKNPYGHDIYVGAGTGNNDYAPGSLEPLYLNGVTMETSYVVYNVTTNVTYLAIPPTCSCRWAPVKDLYSMPALVRLRDFYWIGLYYFADGSYEVGKVYDQPLAYGITMSHAENNQEIQTTVAVVLQCVIA